MCARCRAIACVRWNWLPKIDKHVLVQKPMAVDLDTAARMITIARDAGIQLGVISQHRFDDSILFLKRALAHRTGWAGFSRPMPT